MRGRCLTYRACRLFRATSRAESSGNSSKRRAHFLDERVCRGQTVCHSAQDPAILLNRAKRPGIEREKSSGQCQQFRNDLRFERNGSDYECRPQTAHRVHVERPAVTHSRQFSGWRDVLAPFAYADEIFPRANRKKYRGHARCERHDAKLFDRPNAFCRGVRRDFHRGRV
jgi:hypothetical protein